MMRDQPQIKDLPPDEVCSAALEVVTCIFEALELTPVQRHYAALSLEANAGKPDADPTYVRMACAVAQKLREDSA